jgi:trimeric autotransporter adhesin
MAIGRITGQMLSSQLNRDTTDLKFSTTGETNLLVLDASNDRIGIGTASPTVQFETTGSAIIGTDLTVTGNLTVNGSTTTINTTNLTVDDKNIELAHSLSGQAPTDAAADGGGIILKGDTDHTILWSNANNSWDFSENVSVATGSAFQINNSNVLDANNLTLENIQIAGNVITSASNADISLQPSGTGNVLIEGIQISGTVITGTDSTVISFGGNKLSGVGEPTGESDVATKSYVDSQVGSANTLTLGDDASNSASVNLNSGENLKFKSGNSMTLSVSGNTVTSALNDKITVDEIAAKDSSAVSIQSPTQLDSTLQVAGASTFQGDIVISSGSITSASGTINFGDDILTTTGDVNANDITLSGNIDMTANASITIGSGDSTSDFIVNFDGTDAYITKSATSGETYIRSRNFSIQNNDGTQTFITGGHGGATELYHGGVAGPALTTTVSGGISIPNGTLLVNVIASGDSTSVRIDDSLGVDGSLDVGGTFTIANGQGITAILDEDNMASNSANALATQQSIKAYVDSVAGGTITLGDSASNAGSVDINAGQDLEFRAGNSITPTVSGNGVTIALDNNIVVDAISSASSTFVRINDSLETEAAQINSTLTVDGDAQIKGNLTVQGTTTYIETTNTKVSDPLLLLNNGNSGGADIDSGIMIERGSAGNNAVFYWNEGDDRFKAVLSTSAESATSIADDSYATLNVGGLVMSAESVVITSILDEDNFASNSDTALATQQSIKAYVDSVAGGTITLGDSASNSGSVDINAGQDLEFRSGDSLTLTVAGNGVTAALNDNITVNQIGAKDSSAVSITSPLQTSTIQASGNITVNGGTVSAGSGSTFGDLTLANGSITDASGTIDFGDENLTLTGNITTTGGTVSATQFTAGTLTITDGQITDTDGTIGFNDINLDGIDQLTTSSIVTNVISSSASTSVVVNDGLQVDGSLDVGTNFTISNGTSINAILDEDNFASDSATALATQQSIKAYVDSQVSASNTLTIGDDGSTEISLNLDDVLNVKGGNSITSSVAGDSLTFALDDRITVDEIAAKDSSAVSVQSPLQLDSTLQVAGIGTIGSIQISGNVISSTDSSQINFGQHQLTDVADPTQASDVATKSYVDSQTSSIVTQIGISDSASNRSDLTLGTNDLEFRQGDSITPTVAGTGVTFNLNDNITVNQIGAKDSTAVSITSNTQVDGTLQVSGASTLVGNVSSSGSITAGTSFIIGGADLNETDLEKLDGITDGTGAANKALVLDASQDITSGVNVFTATTGDFQTVKVNTIESDDSTAVTVNDGLQVNGNFGFNEGVTVTQILDEDNFSSNSATALATQQSIKAYVDAVAEGLHVHASVKAATTQTLALESGDTVTYDNGSSGVGATLTLSTGISTLDGYTLVDGDRILIKNESNTSHNGIYIRTSSTVLTRATDFDTSAEIQGGDFFFVTLGTLNGSNGYVQTEISISVGSTAIIFSQFSGAGQITAGDGMTKTGNTLDVNVDDSTIEINSDTLRVKDAGITNVKLAKSTITVVGDDSTGTAVSLGETFKIAGGESLNASVSADTLTINLDDDITVNQIGAKDSTAVSITSPVQVTGALNTDTSLQIAGSTLVDGILDEDNMASNSATKLATQQSIKAYVDSVAGGTITLGDSASNSGSVNINAGQDLEFRSGDSLTLTVLGNGVTAALNDNITVNQIGAKDSTAVSITSALQTTSIQSSGAVTVNGTFTIGTGSGVTTILDEDTLSSDSDTALATQQSIKAYVDSQITASNTLTLGDDASSEISLNLDDVLNVKGGNSITSSVAGDSLTFALDANISVNQIGALDSTAINITSPVYVSGALNTDTSLQIAGSTLIDGILDEDNFASDSATKLATQQSIKAYVDSVAGGTITLGDSASNAGSVDINAGQDLEFRSGDSITMTVSGNGVTTALNDNITVNQIGAKDSTAVSITSNTQVDGTLQVSGTSTLVGNTTIAEDITIASGSITSASGSISFDNENLTTTGNITGSNITATGNIQVNGDLTVSGTTTSVNSTNLTVSDPLLILSETNSGGADVDSGIMVERGSAGNNAALYWNEGDDKFKAVLTTSQGDATSIVDTSVATIVANIESTGSSVFGDITVNQIGANDSSAVSIVSPLQTSTIQASGNITVNGGTVSAGSGSTFGDLTLSDGSITDASGAIDFGDENLTLTGNITTTGGTVSATQFTAGTLTITDGQITDSDGTIGFNDINLDGIDTLTASTIDTNIIQSTNSTKVNVQDSLEVDGSLDVGSNFTISNGTSINAILDEDNFASDSATALATQQSIKAYVDTQISASSVASLNDIGDVDAASGNKLDGDILVVNDDSSNVFTLSSQLTTGMRLPTGTTAQRPPIYSGVIRYNTETGLYEGSTDGSTWSAFAMAGNAETLTKDVFTGDDGATYNWSNITDPTSGDGNNGALGLIVYIDNIIQEPTQNYTISPTAITFDSVVHSGARIVVIQGFDGGAGGAGGGAGFTTITNSDVDSAVENIDTFAVTTYRAAHYHYVIENDDISEFQTGQIHVLHDGTSAQITEFGITRTGNNDLITFSVDISGSDFRLRGSAQAPNSKIKLKRVHLEVQ